MGKLLQAIFLDGPQAGAAFEAWQAEVDIDTAGLEAYYLLPLLYCSLERQGIEHRWLDRLRGVYRKMWYTHQLNLQAAAELAQDLETAGIGPCVLGLAAQPGDSESFIRPRIAMPLVIPGHQSAAALRLATELGWASLHANRSTMTASYFFWHSRLQLKAKDGRRILFGWHFLDEWPAAAADAAFRARSMLFDPGNRNLAALDPSAALLLACQAGASSLSSLADAALILTSQPAVDWDWLCAIAQMARIEAWVLAALTTLSNLLGLSVPEHVFHRLTSGPSTTILTDPNGMGQGHALSALRRQVRRFQRLARAQGIAPTPRAFISYLQQIWDLPTTGAVFRYAAGKVIRRQA